MPQQNVPVGTSQDKLKIPYPQPGPSTHHSILYNDGITWSESQYRLESTEGLGKAQSTIGQLSSNMRLHYDAGQICHLHLICQADGLYT